MSDDCNQLFEPVRDLSNSVAVLLNDVKAIKQSPPSHKLGSPPSIDLPNPTGIRKIVLEAVEIRERKKSRLCDH